MVSRWLKSRVMIGAGLTFLVAFGGLGTVLGKAKALRILRGTGYIARYLAGQTADFAVRGGYTKDGSLLLYDRVEFWVNSKATLRAHQEGTSRRFYELGQYLRENGVEIVKLPIPPKHMVEQDEFKIAVPNPTVRESWNKEQVEQINPDLVYRSLLDADPANTVDLLGAYRAAYRESGGQKLFIPWGYHWTSFGIAVAAKEILHNLKMKGYGIDNIDIRKIGTSPFITNERLLGLFQLPTTFLYHRKEFNWRETLYSVRSTRVPGKQPGRVIFIADSNGDRFREGGPSMGKLLEMNLRRPLVDASHQGEGGVGAFRKFIADGNVLHPGDLVVFEWIVPGFIDEEEGLKLRPRIEPDRQLAKTKPSTNRPRRKH